MIIRQAENSDLADVLALYTHLHGNQMPSLNDSLIKLWMQIINDPNHYVLLGIEDKLIISSCVLLIVPNLTHNQRPYALIENVVTHKDYRRRGCATSVLNFAKEIATQNNCYKIMLMTGSKEESTLRFYGQAGYNSHDKTAFVQWLNA